MLLPQPPTTIPNLSKGARIIKKTTKILIAAATVAAIVGVGSVSFAAWTSNVSAMTTATGTTGTINTLGDIVVTPADGTYTVSEGKITMNSLLPIDHVSDGLTYWTFTVSTSSVTGTATPHYSLAGTITPNTDAALYWTTTVPTTETAGTLITANASLLTNVQSGTPVYVYMVATSVKAINAKISLTFSQA